MKFRFVHLAALCATVTLGISLAIAPPAGAQAGTGSAATSQTGESHSADSEKAATTADRPVTIMSVQVKVVNVLTTVRDKHGKMVNGLTKDDFTLAEDSRPQNIHYFARETDIPLTLGLLVDTSLSQRRVLGEERSASQSFLSQMLRENKDKAFVIHFDREVELLQDLTSSREKLQAALELLEAPQFNRTSGSNSPGGGGGPASGSGGGPGHHRGGGALLYDAVYLASDELMQKQQGRKALIVLSDTVWIPAARKVLTRRSSRLNAQTAWSTPFCSRMTRHTATAEVSAEQALVFQAWAGRESAAAEWEGLGEVGAGFPRSMRMEKKSWNEFRKRQAGDYLRSPRKNRSIKSIPRLKRNYAINTASVTLPTGEIQPRRAITSSRLPLSREDSLSRQERVTTEANRLKRLSALYRSTPYILKVTISR